MEIEAKFVVPNKETLAELQDLDSLGDYALAESEVKPMRDSYLDTPEREMLNESYALRRREEDNYTVMTLKGLGAVKGAIHHREELEVKLPPDGARGAWVNSAVYARIFEMVGTATLQILCHVDQVRVVRQVLQGERLVALMSMDEVILQVRDERQTHYQLEIEMVGDGTEDDLATIADIFTHNWALRPEPISKFERALAFADSSAQADALLSPEEGEILLTIAQQEEPLYARRAWALLGLNDRLSTREAGKQASLSSRRVRYWLRRFERDGLGIFPEEVLDRARLGGEEVNGLSLKVTDAPAKKEEQLPSEPKSAEKDVGLSLDDSMGEAARKVFRFHFAVMLDYEPGTREGKDIEELHKMRVATRRMRAAEQVFRSYLDGKTMQPFVKELRRAGQALGKVRDLDVFWEKTEDYLDKQPKSKQYELDPLQMAWKAERKSNRREMMDYLDSNSFAAFKDEFAAFLDEPGAGVLPVGKNGYPTPHRLRHVIPMVLYKRYAAVRAYEDVVSQPDTPQEVFHQLRIDCKRLRYALEFFEEVLGSETESLIKTIKGVQGNLGDLQDSVVACAMLRDFFTWGTLHQAKIKKAGLPPETVVAPGVAMYLAARQVEQQELLEGFPKAWQKLRGPEFGQSLARVVERL